MCIFLYQRVQIPSDTDGGNDAEDTEKSFSPGTTEFKAESHAVIFSKVYYEPVEYPVFFAGKHVSLNPEFRHLI